jgi:type IV pilus assembly protein PilO
MESGSLFEKIEKIKMPIRIVILVGTLALLGGLFAWQVYIPKTKEIAKTKQEIVSLKKKLDLAIRTEKKVKEFRARKAEVLAQFKAALRLLPNKKEIPSLLRNITQLGTDSRLEFRLFSPQGEKSKGFYMEIPVNIEVSGNYHDVAVFFDRVGGMDRIVNILNVSMKPVGTRSTQLNTTCTAVTYRFKGGINEAKTK